MHHAETIKKNAKDSCQAQVESYLIGKIEVGVWAVGAKIPSERELAEELGVSRTTVRNAVLALTSRGMFDRSIGQGTFVKRGPAPREEARTTKGTLGYVVCKARAGRRPLASESFYFDVFSGIEEETARSGRHTLFSYLDDFDADEVAAFASFLDKVDGVVVEEASNRDFLARLKESGTPAVLLAPSESASGMDLVTMDLAAGVGIAVRALRAAGHEGIGIVNGPLSIGTARVRFAAWKAAMAESGVQVDDSLSDAAADWTAEAGYEAALRLLKRRGGITALFCANDLLAIGALSALAELGRRVPEEVSVMGFDDTELARHASPPLSTMRIHSRDMARAAARRLLERIEFADLPAIKIEFPIDLVERKSVAEVVGKRG
jgi:LacI family transcriptional regulator